MKTKEKTAENTLSETAPASPARSVEVESILEPLNAALESVRSEANNLAETRKMHEERLVGLQSQKTTLEQKVKDMHSYRLNEEVDAEELELSISASERGLETLVRRQTKAKVEVPDDAGLQNVWCGFVAEFGAMKERIISLHYRQTVIDLEKICTLPAEFYREREVQHGCSWCHHDGTVRIQVQTSRFIIDGGHVLQRAGCLHLACPLGGDHTQIAVEGVRDIRAELELITDLSALPPYEQPVISTPAVKVVSIPVSTPKPQRGVDARPPDFKTALHPMSRGMLDQSAAAEERNTEQLKAWEKAGILPEGARGSLRVNAFMPKK